MSLCVLCADVFQKVPRCSYPQKETDTSLPMKDLHHNFETSMGRDGIRCCWTSVVLRAWIRMVCASRWEHLLTLTCRCLCLCPQPVPHLSLSLIKLHICLDLVIIQDCLKCHPVLLLSSNTYKDKNLIKECKKANIYNISTSLHSVAKKQ